MVIRFFLNVTILFCLTCTCFSESFGTWAVSSLEGRGGISETDAATFSDSLESELLKTGKFKMIGRSRMSEIIKEQERSLICGDSSCAIELGRILAVQNIVYGSVSRVGSSFTVVCTLANVETGELERTASFNKARSIDELLKIGMPSVARQLADIDDDESALNELREEPISRQKKAWYTENGTWIAGGVAVVAGGAVLLGNSGGSSDDSGGEADGSVAGTWRGRAGTGQTQASLSLGQSGSSLLGTLAWYGTSVPVSGNVSGNRVTLSVQGTKNEGDDFWDLERRDNSLTGFGTKYTGESYPVNLTR